MKKIFISLCVAILLFNIVSPALAATKEDYDHKELLQYKGYGQAMYETVVEETTFITGRYTENKEYVNKSIDQIIDYAKFWKNEASDFIAEDSLRDAIERGGGYLLTVGDWVKKLFTGYGEKYHPPEVIQAIYDFTPYVKNIKTSLQTDAPQNDAVDIIMEFDVIDNFKITWSGVNGYPNSYSFLSGYRNTVVLRVTSFVEGVNNYSEYRSTVYVTNISIGISKPTSYGVKENGYLFKKNYPEREQASKARLDFIESVVIPQYASKSGNVNDTLNSFINDVNSGPSNNLKANVIMTPGGVKPNIYDKFKEHVDTKINNMATPQPRPYLSCPNGTKIEMSISGSTFLGVDGKVLIVNKDGTAEIDSAICNLGWDKPPIKYIDDKAAIQTPDGKWQDAETGETIQGGEEEGEDGECGMLCSLGKLTKFIVDFFEKLLDFFIKIYVPEDLDFISEGFDEIKTKFDEKLSILSSMKDFFTNLFVPQDENPAIDYVIDLPAVGKPIKLLDMELINVGVPIMKRVISAVIVIFTVIHVYRKIVGDGGVMEK